LFVGPLGYHVRRGQPLHAIYVWRYIAPVLVRRIVPQSPTTVAVSAFTNEMP
jgi:hypothetical protein